MQYKFVQISDVCFNHSITTDTEINKLIKSIREASFNKVIDLCIKERATALLICGNLYDENNITLQTVQLLKNAFTRLKSNNIAIIYAHGYMDKGSLVKNLKKEVFDFRTGYGKTDYTLGYDLDKVNFAGMGYSKMLMLEDEFMDAGNADELTIGLMYIDPNIYGDTMIDTIRKRLSKSNVDCWALGGSKKYIAYNKKSKSCYAGSLGINTDIIPGCSIINVNNKKRITTSFVNISDYVFKAITQITTDSHSDIYKLLEDCVLNILDNKDLNKKNIIKLNIKGPCICYESLSDHLKELQKEIAKLTDVKLCINISELYKKVELTKALEEETDINLLLEKYRKLYDDETFNRMIYSLQARGVLYLEDEADIDKDQLLKGIDSILVESKKDN